MEKVGSVFEDRTEEGSAQQYFEFYGYLSQQQNMLEDFIRTYTYRHAIFANISDFNNKIVLDVGTGSGILAIFAAQAGAAKVYAVEASTMAKHAEKLIQGNMLQDKITVIAGKIEEVEIPEMVDIIISEPMGYMLVNERMLETFLYAKKFLKPNGKMYPTRGDLYVAPFSDLNLYLEMLHKADFWSQFNFHGVNLLSLRDDAMQEYFGQPVIGEFDMDICMSKSQSHVVEFDKAVEEDLHKIGKKIFAFFNIFLLKK